MNKNVTKMTYFRVGFFASSLLLFSSSAMAQGGSTSNEVVKQEYIPLGESTNHIDYSAKVVECNGVNQILLTAFNENPTDQVADFALTVTNVDGESFSRTFNVAILKAEIYAAQCGDTAHDNLKIELPANFDAANVQVTIVYNN
jgi:hypothetical protein